MIPRQLSVESTSEISSSSSSSSIINMTKKGISTTTTTTTTKQSNRKRPPVFPTRLYDMLENAERDGYAQLISWCGDGRSFKIHTETDEDIVPILKLKFNQTRFKSFLRQLQLYGFQRRYKGSRTGECRHPLLVRHHREVLCNKSIKDFQKAAAAAAVTATANAGRFFTSTATRIVSPTHPRSLVSLETSPLRSPCSPIPSASTTLLSTAQSTTPHISTALPPPPLPPPPAAAAAATMFPPPLPPSLEYCRNSVIPIKLANLVLQEKDDANDDDDDDHSSSTVHDDKEDDADDDHNDTTNNDNCLIFDRNFFDTVAATNIVITPIMMTTEDEVLPHWTSSSLELSLLEGL